MAQSPLLSIPRKATTDADWAGPIRSTIAHSFGESPDAYAEEISVLQRCRQDAVRGAGSDTTARDLLYKYFGQLELLELRFSEVKVSFGWNDAFTDKLTTQTSLAFEKASIIHLLASVLSSLAASQSRADPEGLKRAYFNARATAGMLTYINDNFLHAPSTDLSREVVHLLINLMLAQATEVFLEKLIEEKKAPSLVARTANQVASMYNGLVDEMREFQGKNVFDRMWMNVLQAKAKLFASIAQFQRAKADEAAGKHGTALVRFKLADTLAQEAQRAAGSFNWSFVSSSSPTLPHDAGQSLHDISKAHATLCAEAKTQAIRDNDLIYHDILPSEAALPVIEKLPPATPITIQEVYANADVSKLIGPDIFARLIPLAVHESASVYSEEKAKLARGEVERVEMSEVEVRTALEHLGLPGIIQQWRRLADGEDADTDVDVSSDVLRIAADVSESGGSTDARVRQLEGERTRCERELQDLSAQLDTESRECERMRAKYAPNFTQAPSGPQTSHLRSTISSNLASLKAAAASDAQVVALWHDIQPDMAILERGKDAVRAAAADVAAGKTTAAPPADAGMSLLDLQDEEQVRPRLDAAEQEQLRGAAKDASDKLDRLNKIRRERDDVLKDLKEKIQNDDVSNLLLLNRRNASVEPQLFAAELEKFRPYQSRLSSAVSALKTLTTELEAIVQRVSRGQGVRERQRSAKARATRVREWERRLERAGASHVQLAEGLAKALAFYESIDRVAADLKREVRAFVTPRDAERNRLVADLETRNRIGGGGAGASPSPTASSRGLDAQFASMGLGSGSSSAPSAPASKYGAYPPPPPPKPSTPAYPQQSAYPAPSAPSAYPAPPAPPKPSNPYDFNLAGLPSAFSTSTAAAAPSPPRTSATSPGAYPPPPRPAGGTYPSFPSAPTGAPSYPSPPAGASYPSPPAQPYTNYSQGSYPAPPAPYRSSSASYPAPPQQPQQQQPQPQPQQQQQQQPQQYQSPPQGYQSPPQQQQYQSPPQQYQSPPPQQQQQYQPPQRQYSYPQPPQQQQQPYPQGGYGGYSYPTPGGYQGQQQQQQPQQPQQPPQQQQGQQPGQQPGQGQYGYQYGGYQY